MLPKTNQSLTRLLKSIWNLPVIAAYFVFNYSKIPSLHWLSLLRRYGILVREVDFQSKENRIFLRRLGIAIASHPPEFILSSYLAACDLHENADATFSLSDDAVIIAEIDNLFFKVTTAEEFFILTELYLAGDYNAYLPEDCILIDIGMNVGFTSLFLAKKNSSATVFGFEPVRRNFEHALANFLANDCINDRIIPSNIGLGLANEIAEISIPKDSFGSGTILKPPAAQVLQRDSIIETIQICSASQVIGEILNEYSDRPIVIKLDTEGAEYDIIESLIQGSIVHRVTYFMIEWHSSVPGKNVETLANIFRENGFITQYLNTKCQAGMLYAFNPFSLTPNKME